MRTVAGAALLLAASPVLAGDASSLSPSAESVLFESPPVVQTAALYTQTLQEAPANVTVITRDEIRRYGYRTLAEALANVRGFYVSYDGELYYAGVRGFSLPGDYNTRTLVMLNGHYLTDNVYGAMYMFGQDFGLDMDLVERIEIVRGPSSALYGSNGVLATINIFTRAPADSPRAAVSAELGSFGQEKALLSSSFYLGRGANLLVAASAFHARGRRIEAAELGGLATDSVGAEQGYHSLAQLTWRHWSVTANFHGRRGLAPAGWYGTVFGDTGTSTRDAHNFVEAAWKGPVGSHAELEWRLYYDQYRYYGRYDFTGENAVTDSRDYALGDWVGSRLAYRRTLSRYGELTLGAQFDLDVRNLQVSEYVWPYYDRYRETSRPQRSYGVFAQHVYQLSRAWTLYTGLRFDDSRRRRSFLSPRVASVWKASSTTSYKFTFGRAFRNPSTFEQYWEPNPLLAPESVNAFEAAREQRLWGRLDLVATAFHYRLAGLIEGVPINENTLQYRNVSAARATGVELELSGRPAASLETAAGVSLQRARYADPDRRLPNSPLALIYVRGSAPVASDRLVASIAMRYVAARGSPCGFEVPSYLVADLTLTTNRLHRDFDLQFGLRNLTGRRYSDPLSPEHLTQLMPGPGRNAFVKLIWRYGD